MHSDPTIEFFCAICGTSLSVEAGMGGKLVECPACARVIPVPGKLPLPGGAAYRPVFTPEILSIEMTFACPGCDRDLLADARVQGADFECPRCGATGVVPRWSRESSPAGEPQIPALVLSADEIELLSGERPLPLFPHAEAQTTT